MRMRLIIFEIAGIGSETHLIQLLPIHCFGLKLTSCYLVYHPNINFAARAQKQTDIPTQQNYLQVVRSYAKFSHTPSNHKIRLKEKNEEKPRAKTISPDPTPICLNFISYSAIKRFFFL